MFSYCSCFEKSNTKLVSAIVDAVLWFVEAFTMFSHRACFEKATLWRFLNAELCLCMFFYTVFLYFLFILESKKCRFPSVAETFGISPKVGEQQKS